jgi:hypothetical protein
MKQVITGIHDYTTLSKFETYCGWRPLQNKYSLEIASLEGSVHFYIRCGQKVRNAVEAQIYAFYPDAEIFEVEDYTRRVPKYLPNADWDVWGVTMKLVKDDGYPIRTYSRFKEDITGEMIDPIGSVVEVMSNMGVGQYAWLQILMTSAAEKEYIPDAIKALHEIMQLPDDKKKVINKMFGVPEEKKGLFSTLGGEMLSLLTTTISGLFGGSMEPEKKTKEDFDINKLTIPQQEAVKAILENIADMGYKTSIRYVYVGKKENWDKPLGVGSLLGALKLTNDAVLNAMRTDSDTKTYAQYYFIEPRLRYRQRKIVQNYRDRDYAGTGFYFTAEELATIYHFPDISVKSPTVNRVSAKKGDAPANLPTGLDELFSE